MAVPGSGPEQGEEQGRRQGAAPAGGRAPHEVHVTRRWFLMILGGAVAAVVGLPRLFKELGGAGSSGGKGGDDSVTVAGFPVRSVDAAPRVPLKDWVIEVDGLVDHPVKVDYAMWSALPRVEETVDFHCVEGWTVTDVRWGGVRPADLVALAVKSPKATHLVFHAFGGTYSDSIPLDVADDPRTMLADTLDGAPLSGEHGGPVRLVVPRQLAYKSVKFVRRVEVTDHPIDGYWEQRGYPADAPAPA